MTTQMTISLPATAQGWLYRRSGSYRRTILKGISQAGAFHYAKRYEFANARWARGKYTVVDGVRFVEV
jgi:hypothetical protein